MLEGKGSTLEELLLVLLSQVLATDRKKPKPFADVSLSLFMSNKASLGGKNDKTGISSLWGPDLPQTKTKEPPDSCDGLQRHPVV